MVTLGAMEKMAKLVQQEARAQKVPKEHQEILDQMDQMDLWAQKYVSQPSWFFFLGKVFIVHIYS